MSAINLQATRRQLKDAVALIMAVSETIREAGQVPSGVLYAALMPRVDLAGFQKIVATLKGAGVVEESGDVLRWVGPKSEASK